MSSYAHVVQTTEKQVISRRRKNENVFKMSKEGKCTCKACKNTVFHCQICKFVGFLLSSSSWLLKLPSITTPCPPRKTILKLYGKALYERYINGKEQVETLRQIRLRYRGRTLYTGIFTMIAIMVTEFIGRAVRDKCLSSIAGYVI